MTVAHEREEQHLCQPRVQFRKAHLSDSGQAAWAERSFAPGEHSSAKRRLWLCPSACQPPGHGCPPRAEAPSPGLQSNGPGLGGNEAYLRKRVTRRVRESYLRLLGGHPSGLMASSCHSRPGATTGSPGTPSALPTAMLLLSGALVSGPYALITTAVSADLVSGRALRYCHV